MNRPCGKLQLITDTAEPRLTVSFNKKSAENNL